MSLTEFRRLVPISVQGDRFLVDATQIIGVEKGDQVQRNPANGAPHGWLLGSSDGSEVFDLADILGKASNEDSPSGPGSVLIFSRSNGELWGLLVDHSDGSIQVPTDDVLSLSEVVESALYSAIVQLQDGPAVLLAAELLHPEDGERGGLDLEEFPKPTRREPPRLAVAEPVNPSRKMVWLSIDSEGDLLIGLSARQVVEVRDPLPIAPIPDSQHDIAGIVLVDREALPVIDLNRLLGVSRTNGSQARMLIARCTRSGRKVGLPISANIQLVDLPVSHEVNRIDPGQAPWIRGSFKVDGATLMIPDLDAILD